MSRGYVAPDPRRLYGPTDPPPGFHYLAVPDTDWRVLPEERRHYFCRRMGAGHVMCTNFGVAELQRGRSSTRSRFGRSWWAYCADHLYGRWIEDGVVMSWRLERDA